MLARWEAAAQGPTSPRREDDEAADEEGIGRILALSDGVFAIAITLLILEIVVPATTSDAGLPKALLALWPRYLAYVVSFVVIARFWMIHRLAFRLIARDDAALVWLNLLLLMFVAFLPFPTAVLGAHAGSPAAAVLYATSVILASIASAASWYASGSGRLLRPDVGRARVRALRARGLAGPVFFALTLPIAVFAPYVAEIVWILVFPPTRPTDLHLLQLMTCTISAARSGSHPESMRQPPERRRKPRSA